MKRNSFLGCGLLLLAVACLPARAAQLGVSLSFSSYTDCLGKVQKLQAAAGDAQHASGEITDETSRNAYCRNLFPVMETVNNEHGTPVNKVDQGVTPGKSNVGLATGGTVTAASAPAAPAKVSTVSFGEVPARSKGDRDDDDPAGESPRKMEAPKFGAAMAQGSFASPSPAAPLPAAASSGGSTGSTPNAVSKEGQNAYQSYMASLERQPASAEPARGLAGIPTFPVSAGKEEQVSPGSSASSGTKRKGEEHGPAPGANPPKPGKPGVPTRDPGQIDFADLQKMLLDPKLDSPAARQLRSREEALSVSLFDRVSRVYRARGSHFRQGARK